LLLIGVIGCQRTVRSNGSNLFSLEEDKLIINTPNVKDMHSAESTKEIFKIDDSTPIKSGVFFM
jgi:hypothetical protein